MSYIIKSQRGKVIPGERDLWCPYCPAGPFTKLGVHTTRIHGVTAEDLQEQGYETCSTEHREVMKQVLLDRREDGIVMPTPRQKTCKHGRHALRGSNLLWDARGKRQCRKCYNEYQKLWQRRRNGTDLGPRVCTAPDCNRKFKPTVGKQRFCSMACRLRSWNRIRPRCKRRGCSDHRHAKDLCARHYQQQRRRARSR